MRFNFVWLFMLVLQTGYSQMYKVDGKKAENIQKGITYVIMKDPNSTDVAGIKEAIRLGWTFTKGIEFITAEEIRKYPAPENTFMSLQAQVFYSTGSTSSTAAATRPFSYIDLNIWQCDQKYFTAKRKLEKKDRQEVASISLSTDLKTADSSQEEIDSWNWNLQGKVYNWLPGIIKNRLQDIGQILTLKIQESYVTGKPNETELARLKNETLYIPEFSLITAREKMNDKPDKLFADYDFSYKIISAEELSRRIMNEENFYYATQTRDGTYAVLEVTKSRTGEVIFSTRTVWTLKDKDLKELSEAVIKSVKRKSKQKS